LILEINIRFFIF